jgi:hypothetical protein
MLVVQESATSPSGNRIAPASSVSTRAGRTSYSISTSSRASSAVARSIATTTAIG